jgi:UDP-N-acetylglucosamine--N-acetylmuramyl-(pentapeptide) pyrophosphoryl-undecaprenol N-acetylglucosamine transferase
MTMKIAIAAGGTGGHIFPGIAIGKEILASTSDVEVLFIGARGGLETTIVPKYGFKVLQIEIRKFHRRFTFENLLFPLYLVKGIIETMKILHIYKIKCLIGCGGFVTGAAGLAAVFAGIPIFLQEQNSFPGISTRLLANFSNAVYLGFPDARKYLKSVQKKLVFAGNPLRKFPNIQRGNALRLWSLEDKPTVFIYGGSQGSHTINETSAEIIDDLLQNEVQIIFQTGYQDYERFMKKFSNRKGLVIKPFFDNIVSVYKISSLAICRAGALSLSELAYFGVPAIIIPFPYSAGNHQIRNARLFEGKKAAKVIIEEKLQSDILLDEILNIINNKNLLEEMRQGMKKLAPVNATRDIVDDIFQKLEIKKVRKCLTEIHP